MAVNPTKYGDKTPPTESHRCNADLLLQKCLEGWQCRIHSLTHIFGVELSRADAGTGYCFKPEAKLFWREPGGSSFTKPGIFFSMAATASAQRPCFKYVDTRWRKASWHRCHFSSST